MAAQTHGAVDSLLGLLSSAIKDEARLLGGVHGDVQFIKDEMDSMNGFLLHLTKTEGEHDDQLRAWMKQVRDIAYIAEDCIELYVRDLSPLDGDGSMWAFLRHLPVFLWTAPARHRLATKIRELKVRVREVGERRQRYGVTVPGTAGIKPAAKPPGHDDKDQEKIRDEFLRALEAVVAGVLPSDHQLASEETGASAGTRRRTEASTVDASLFNKAIALLPAGLPSEAATIRAILGKCSPDDAKLSTTTMFLRALCAYPYATKQELVKLEGKLKEGADEVKELVKVFCYSKLTTQQKSCLQYLTAFLKETKISRTSLVRRWVAEGLVARQHEKQTLEEAGERCLGELVLRGFIRPVVIGDAGTIKSCVMDKPVRDFIISIAQSENFVVGLPAHLHRQVQIREIVQLPRPPQQQARRCRNMGNLCGRDGTAAAASDSTAAPGANKEPMDKLVELLKTLPELYRLNVLDLGGCQGLKTRHLKSICKVISLKYLSLRNTDVSSLPARRMQALRLLETLDIRDTIIPPTDTKRISLPRLKHLLAGCRLTTGGGGGGDARTSAEVLPLSAAHMPRRIGTMTNMVTLSRVQVPEDGTGLDGVAKLTRLRKLSLVLHGNEHSNAAKYLRRVISGLAESLRSLSIWLAHGSPLNISMDGTTSFDVSRMILENLDINGKISLPWIENVHTLANVTLRDTLWEDEGLQKLGTLHGLRCLRLRRSSLSNSALNFTVGKFNALKFLLLDGDDTITSITFTDGAAPMLEKIVWTFHSMNNEDPISGINHLHNLKVVELRGDDINQTQFLKLEQAIAAHPGRPIFRYSFDVIVTAE